MALQTTIAAALVPGGYAATMDHLQAARVLASMLAPAVRGYRAQGMRLPTSPSPALHALALEAERKENDQANISPEHMQLLRGFGMNARFSQDLPFALRHASLYQPLDLSGRRHISFLRFLSGGQTTPRPSNVPDAADADAALADYQALRARLDRVQRPSTIKTTAQVVKDMAIMIGNGLLAVWHFLLSVPSRIAAWRAMTPEDWAKWKSETWATVKHEAHHYWVGAKLLGYETRIAARHAWKAAQGKALSRRERAQLTRTTADLFRLVPMVIIIVIPFLEFALPLLLRIFPNMLPSTFEDKLKKEEELKRRLSVRLELAKFLQDTVAEMAADIARRKGSSQEAQELKEFISNVRAGKEVDNAQIIKFARLFNDELTLDHLERVQLVSMCQFVGINPFGTDAFLRTRLRQHLQQIKQDDYEIEQEGLENMTEDELRQACRARGMRAPYGEGAQKFMERQMRDWLDLSLHRGLPSSLLLLSRAFTITAGGTPKDVGAAKDEKYEKLKETLGVIPGEVVDSVTVEKLGGVGGVEALQQRLEFLVREEEAIRAEIRRTEEASKAAADAEAAMKRAIQDGKVALSNVVHAASQPIGLKSSAIAPEEAAAEAAAAKDKRLKAIIGSLVEMATTSAVAKERAMFMDLMRKEMDRVNIVLTESGGKGSSTGAMSFSSKGLEVAKDKVLEEDGDSTAGTAPATRTTAQLLPSRLGERVSRMLTSIEAELDAVETKIGGKLHFLDVDKDGKVSESELENALQYLRDQLSPEEMSELLVRLKKAASAAASGVIEVSGLANLAKGENNEDAGEASGQTSTAAAPAGQQAGVAK